MIQKNPRLADGALQDPRMIDVLGALMGIDMQGFSRPEGSDELPGGISKDHMASPPSSPPTQPSASSSKPPPPAPEDDIEMADEDDEEAAAKKEALELKKVGSEAYKKKDFDEAAKNFEKAWDVWPQDITFLTNLGGTCIWVSNTICTQIDLSTQPCTLSKLSMTSVLRRARRQ